MKKRIMLVIFTLFSIVVFSLCTTLTVRTVMANNYCKTYYDAVKEIRNTSDAEVIAENLKIAKDFLAKNQGSKQLIRDIRLAESNLEYVTSDEVEKIGNASEEFESFKKELDTEDFMSYTGSLRFNLLNDGVYGIKALSFKKILIVDISGLIVIGICMYLMYVKQNI